MRKLEDRVFKTVLTNSRFLVPNTVGKVCVQAAHKTWTTSGRLPHQSTTPLVVAHRAVAKGSGFTTHCTHFVYSFVHRQCNEFTSVINCFSTLSTAPIKSMST